jgi:hypothetical protein
MPLASFDDRELDILLALAAPLPEPCRSDFLEAVATELARFPERGDGLLHRVARDAQRKFLTPLSSHSAAFHSKYSR